MIELDGSMLEGGGQILRMAVSYSSLLLRPIKVYNIRQGRNDPGLKSQHLKTLEAAAEICNAEVNGLFLGSKEITFYPSEIKGGSYSFNIGTAGSISLFLQCIAPIASYANSEVNLRIVGGTNVRWSPPMHILDNVIWNALRKIGFNGNLNVKKHGFYPKGGGIVEVKIRPIKQLQSLKADIRQEKMSIKGISLCCNLPRHVAERQRRSASKLLACAGYDDSIQIDDIKEEKPFSQGSVICLWVDSPGVFIGFSALGEKGKQSEKVGVEAVGGLLRELNSDCCVDFHTADNLILWASLAVGETKFTTSKVSLHTKTAIELARIFTDASIEVKSDKCPKVSIQGIGYKP